jgi:anti-anti-sigma factor
MGELKLRTRQLSDDVILVDVAGTLDGHTHAEFDALLKRLFDERCPKIVFDLSHLEYLASAGAGAFIAANAQAQEMGGGICFLSPSRNARTVFNLLGLDRIFPFADDEETAVDLLN